MSIFLDTNVLLYSVSIAPEEAAKRRRAEEILARSDCALSIQVLQEFYAQATRVTRLGALSHDAARGLIESWTRHRVQENSLDLLRAALDIKADHGFSFWDSTIIAAARGAGCGVLYTEDMQHGRLVDGVEIVNPFR